LKPGFEARRGGLQNTRDARSNTVRGMFAVRDPNDRRKQARRMARARRRGKSEAEEHMAVESRSIPWRRRARRLGALGVLFALCAGMSGCGLAAAPCRVASAGLKIVPLVGHVAAAPTDACADAIDP